MANTPRTPIRGELTEQMETINQHRPGRPINSTGIFAAQPFMSPKYARHQTIRNQSYGDTMARMFIKVSPDLYDKGRIGLAPS